MYARAISDKLLIAANQKLKEKEYWLAKLAGWVEVSRFHYDYSPQADDYANRDPRETYKTRPFTFAAEICERLIKLSNGADFRLHIILTAALALLLHKYTGHTDIVIGTPIYKQEYDGEFINTTLPIRNQIKDIMTFKELLLQVKQAIFEATENQNYPIEILLEQLDLSFIEEKDIAFPLFDVIVMLENIHDEKYTSHIHTNTVFKFSRKDETITAAVEFNPLRFAESSIERITTHFTTLLRQVISDVDVKAAEASILSIEEKNRILHEFNDTKKEIRRDIAYNQLFEEQVSRRPDKIAAVDQIGQVAYAKLNNEANQIAYFLQDIGIKPGDIAAIYMNRNIKVLTAIIGIFKQGAAYLGIDTDYPAERVENILADSEAKVLIHDNENMEIVDRLKKNLPHLQTILSPRHKSGVGESARHYPGELLHESAGSDFPGNDFSKRDVSNSLAYVIYTSGTTGKPKGVLIHHLGMLNHIFANIDFLSLTQDDILAQTASLSFDISVWQFLAPLITGGITYIIDNRVIVDPTLFADTLQRSKITTLEAVPSMIKALLDLIEQEGFRELEYLRWMIPTGEALSVNLAKQWYRFYPRIKLVNAYGPAETSDDVTLWVIDAAHLENQNTIPIGKPLQNIHVYIMDSYLQLCPIKVPGEICISGLAVGKGYLKDPGKTGQSFLPNPYQADIGDENYATIYRTGDMGYFREDGCIEFLGRRDQQVKVRGFRIELQEIEQQLLSMAEIKDAIVLAKAEEKSDTYLCAYIVPQQEAKLHISRVREFLSLNLPNYMIPAYFVFIDKIPLTANGKINRKALPEPELKADEKYLAPRDKVEEKLVEICAQVLEIDKSIIGMNSNIFEIGGNSLKAMVIIAKIHKELNVKVPLAEIFKNPTMIEIAKYIRQTGVSSYRKIEPVEKKEYYNVSAAQKRMYILHEIGNRDYEINTTFNFGVNLDKKRIAQALKNMIEKHESLRTSFIMIDHKPYQVIHEPGIVDFTINYYETNKLSSLEDAIKVKKIGDDFDIPFDLSRAPLLRVGLIRNDEDKCVILLKTHHIVTDGISNSIFMNEIHSYYDGREPGSLIVQYKDFSEWQHRYLKSEELKKQENYWLLEFSGEIPQVHFPYDYERSSERSGGILSFIIEKHEAKGVDKTSNEDGITGFMFVLAIYNILLSRISGQDDIIIGTFISGREYAYLEGIIGMFVQSLAIRNRVSGDSTIRDFLISVKVKVLNALKNQDYPFDELVEKLQIKREAGRTPIFDAVYNYFSDSERELSIDDAGDEEAIIDYGTNSLFDLVLVVLEKKNCYRCTFGYNSLLFTGETIKRFVTYLKEIYSNAIADINTRLKDINISYELGQAKKNIGSNGENDLFEF